MERKHSTAVDTNFIIYLSIKLKRLNLHLWRILISWCALPVYCENYRYYFISYDVRVSNFQSLSWKLVSSSIERITNGRRHLYWSLWMIVRRVRMLDFMVQVQPRAFTRNMHALSSLFAKMQLIQRYGQMPESWDRTSNKGLEVTIAYLSITGGKNAWIRSTHALLSACRVCDKSIARNQLFFE